MNLQLCRIVLRPRSPLECFDLGFRLLREWWPPLWRLGALLLVPAWALCIGVAWLADWHPLAALVPMALGPILQAPFTLLVGRLLFAQDVRLRDLGRDLLSRLGTWIGGLALTGVTTVLGSLLCGLSIPLLLGMLFVPECSLLEQVNPDRAVRRSMRLVGGNVAAAVVGGVGRWLLMGWCAAVAEAGGIAILGYVLQARVDLPRALEGLASPWVLAGILLSHPLWAIWRLMLYVDVRTRVEGWDLQVGLRAAGLAR